MQRSKTIYNIYIYGLHVVVDLHIVLVLRFNFHNEISLKSFFDQLLKFTAIEMTIIMIIIISYLCFSLCVNFPGSTCKVHSAAGGGGGWCYDIRLPHVNHHKYQLKRCKTQKQMSFNCCTSIKFMILKYSFVCIVLCCVG